MTYVINGPSSGNGVIIGNSSGSDELNGFGLNNYFISMGANDVINAGQGQAHVNLGSFTGLVDQVNLNGYNNNVYTSGNGHYGSQITVTGGAGYSTVDLLNYGGINGVSLGGLNNNITLNGNATNTVAAGSGSDHVTIGSYDDDYFTYTAAVSLGGINNTVTAGDENVTVSGGLGYDTITLGDGTNSVNEYGLHNTITVGGGQNTIIAGTGNDSVTILQGEPSQGEPYLGPDTVTLAGAGNTVTGVYAENISVTNTSATSGTNTVTLGSGNDLVNLAGNFNTITMGDGTDSVTANGNNNTITVGNGNDSISATGSNETITAGNGNDSITATGNNDMITAGSGKDVVSLGTNDLLNLTHSHKGTNVYTHGSTDQIFLSSNANAVIHDLPTGSGLYLQINASGGANGGMIKLDGFSNDIATGVVDLHGFSQYTSFLQVAMNLHSDGHGGISLALGTGQIDFAHAGALTAHNFSFT